MKFRYSLHLALAAGLVLGIPQAALAQGFPEIELSAEQADRLAAMQAAAEAIDRFGDPAAYKAAFQELLAYARTIYPDPHPELVEIEGEIHFADFMLGNSANLRRAMQDAITIYEAAGPKYRENLITSYNNLAVISEMMGFGEESVAPLEKAIAMWREDAPPEGSVELGQGIANLAHTMRALGDYERALELNTEAVAMLEPLFAANRSDPARADALTVALSNRVMYLRDLERYGDAIAVSRDLVARLGELVGADSPRAANILQNGAILLTEQGRAVEGEALARRAVAIREQAFGPESSTTAEAYLALTSILSAQARYADGLPMIEHAWQVLDRELGPDAAQTLEAQGKLGRFHYALGDRDRGLTVMRDLLARMEARHVPWHRDVTDNQEFLARMLADAGRWDELETLLDRAETAQRGTPAEHRRFFTVVQVLQALVEARKGNDAEAIERLERAVPQLYETWREEMEQEGARGARNSEIDHALGWAALAAFEAGDLALGFEIAQHTSMGPSDRAVLRARQRELAQDPAIAAALRNRQDLVERRALALAEFERAASKGDAPAAEAANGRVRALTAEIDALAPELARIELAPVALADLQGRLGADEAVFFALETQFGTQLLAISNGDAVAERAAGEAEELIGLVRSVRTRLDWGLIADTPFDTSETDALHAALFTPAIERVLEGKRRVSVVARGALAKLPFAMLTRTGPDGAREWAVQRFAFSYPVSLAGIGENRAAGGRPAFDRFVGVGAPALPGAAADAPQLAFRGADNATRIAELGRLGLAQGELEAMAAAMAARDTRILAGTAATETALRAIDLARADIITFATHGLMAGELDGLDEAALVLSPPLPGEGEGPDNDGLLTTSEIAAMDLSARWVVLSACNSAAGDRVGDEALGGLAHAFLYAGADRLMVSHWRVRDDVAARLTVSTAQGAAAGLDPAEALRRAQLSLMADSSIAGAAHPALWAPFVLVGN